MRVPPLLILATLTFWGWQIGSIFTGITLGLILELGRRHRPKWQLREEDYQRIWDLCCIIGLCAALYCLANLKGENGIAKLLSFLDWRGPNAVMPVHGAVYFGQWWPILLFPFVVACCFGSRQVHSYTTFFWLLRGKPEFEGRGDVDGIVGYVVLSFLSSSAVLPRGQIFFFTVTALVWCLLWSVRGRRSPAILWVCLAGLAVHAGYWGHIRLHALQGKVEEAVAELSNKFANPHADPMRTHTSIGRIGEVKLSGRIICRLEADSGTAPTLLREASYSIYSSPAWYAGVGKRTRKLRAVKGDAWVVGEAPRSSDRTLRIRGFLGDFLVPKPIGTWRADGLLAEEVTRNDYGTVNVEGGTRYRDFRLHVAKSSAVDWAPMKNHSDRIEDLMLPYREAETIERLAESLQLKGKSELEILLAVQKFFTNEFTYSTYQEVSANQMPSGVTPLEYFLETSKTGHCEFFATATTLLLRAAGVPARYVVGYAVHESDDDRANHYVIRERHGHAWVSYWSQDGRWVDFDTTPASGFDVDAADAPAYEPLADLLNQARFALAGWWRNAGGGPFQKVLLGIAFTILFFIAWRIARQLRRQQSNGRNEDIESRPPCPGEDSEYFEVLAHLEAAGHGQRPDEPLADWLARLRTSHATDVNLLVNLRFLHLRYRFDPDGLSPYERETLSRDCVKLLAD
jgi:hypothetical protein